MLLRRDGKLHQNKFIYNTIMTVNCTINKSIYCTIHQGFVVTEGREHRQKLSGHNCHTY